MRPKAKNIDERPAATELEQRVLEFIGRHGRATSVHLAHNFGKDWLRAHCGYIAMLKRMQKKGLVREVEHLPHQRNFVLADQNPRFPGTGWRPGEQAAFDFPED